MTSIRRYWWLLLVGVIILGLLIGRRSDEGTPSTKTVTLVCVDSTVSTDPVRVDYLPELQGLAGRVSKAGGTIIATRCGPHTTGTADWSVKKSFSVGEKIGPELAKKIRLEQKKELNKEFEELVETVYKDGGSPLGQMLSVLARKCARTGRPCEVYLFSDGEWIDKHINVRDGVSDAEIKEYVRYYSPGLDGLRGVKVSFLEVGHGTEMDEGELKDARRVAEALVKEAEGVVVGWG